MRTGKCIRGEAGFTLIELLIVVAIIGILGAVSVPAYIGSQEKARRSNFLKAAKSSAPDLSHWLQSVVKGASAAGPQAGLIEIDTDWDGAVTAADMTNNAVFSIADSADASVATQYAIARAAEFSPWVNLGGCGAATLFTFNAADPGVGNPGVACTVQLSPAAVSTGSTMAIIASSNGPGGSDTVNTELLLRATVSLE